MSTFRPPREHSVRGPAPCRWRGRRFCGPHRLHPLLASLALAGAAAGLVGCAAPVGRQCLVNEGGGYSAALDSLGLPEFRALPAAQQERRRVEAETWLRQAAVSGRADRKVNALVNAAGLTPDDPRPWLELAGIWRWIGDYLRTSYCLDQAALAVREGGDAIGTAAEVNRRIGLERAWLHYDRAEWREGRGWVRPLLRDATGDADLLLINGLLAAAEGDRSLARRIADDLRRSDPFRADVRWILAVRDRSQGLDREAFNMLLDERTDSGELARGQTRLRGAGELNLELRPTGEHAAECWRDMGEIAERLGEWSFARRWYRESATALPFRDTSCLAQVRHARLTPGPPASRQEVWLAFGRYYVTGSLSAYTALALQRFQEAGEPADREFWAAQVVNGTGILLRRDLDKPYLLRARGLVFAATGMTERALRDLTRASELFTAAGNPDPAVEARLGRTHLLQEDHRQALPHLRLAVTLAPDDAGAWGDLGLTLIMLGERTEAAAALDRALELDGDLAAAWYNRGLMHVHAGDYDRAEGDLARAARLAPENPEIGLLLQKVRGLRRAADEPGAE